MNTSPNAILSPSFPSDLQGWRSELRVLRLPAEPQIKQRALAKLNSATGNAANIAAIINEDPGLCLRLFCETNKTLAPIGNECLSLNHAISLLGFPQVESIIKGCPDLNQQQFPFASQYRQELSISLHAAHQVKQWAGYNPHWTGNELYWPALFHRAPIWALWYYAGEKMRAMEGQRAQAAGASHQQQEQHSLGTTLASLATTLAKDWLLPNTCSQSWQASRRANARQWILLSRIEPEHAHIALEELSQLQRICQSSGFAVALANQVAEEAEWDWLSHRSLRLQRILATALNLPLDRAIALSHFNAAEVSRKHNLSGVMTSASQLLGQYRKADYCLPDEAIETEPGEELIPETTMNPPPTPATATATATNNSPPAEADPVVSIQPPEPEPTKSAPSEQASAFIKAISRLKRQPDSFQNSREIFHLVLETLCHELGLERATVMLPDKQGKQLRTFYSLGAQATPALKNFRCELNTDQLFDKLLQKSSSLHFSKGNAQKIWALLPAGFKQGCSRKTFFIMSVFAGKIPAALIYCDCGISDKPLSAEQYTRFKQLCSAMGYCLQAHSSGQ